MHKNHQDIFKQKEIAYEKSNRNIFSLLFWQAYYCIFFCRKQTG